MGQGAQELGHPLAIDHEASDQRLDCHLRQTPVPWLRQPVIFLLLGKLTLDAWSLALAFGIRLADNVCVGAILLDDKSAGPALSAFGDWPWCHNLCRRRLPAPAGLPAGETLSDNRRNR